MQSSSLLHSKTTATLPTRSGIETVAVGSISKPTSDFDDGHVARPSLDNNKHEGR